MIIKRLQYGTDLGQLYPQFEKRCRNFVEKFAPIEARVPTDAICREMLIRWAQTPDLAGYFGAFQDDRSTTLVGHIAAWIINYYGQFRLFVWQIEADVNSDDTLDRGAEAIKLWIDSLNFQLSPTNQVELAEASTFHDVKVFMRYLSKAGYKPFFSSSTVLFKI